MKFSITAVPRSASTRRRVGKARTEVIDTSKDNRFFDPLYGPLTEPKMVERRYESIWSMTELGHLTPQFLTVIDIRKVD